MRITEWAGLLGPNVSIASICDASYAAAFVSLGNLIAANVPLSMIGNDAGVSTIDGGSPSSDGGTGSGSGGPQPVVANGLRPGGCDVGGSSASGVSCLALLAVSLALARRRRTCCGSRSAAVVRRATERS